MKKVKFGADIFGEDRDSTPDFLRGILGRKTPDCDGSCDDCDSPSREVTGAMKAAALMAIQQSVRELGLPLNALVATIKNTSFHDASKTVSVTFDIEFDDNAYERARHMSELVGNPSLVLV